MPNNLIFCFVAVKFSFCKCPKFWEVKFKFFSFIQKTDRSLRIREIGTILGFPPPISNTLFSNLFPVNLIVKLFEDSHTHGEVKSFPSFYLHTYSSFKGIQCIYFHLKLSNLNILFSFLQHAKTFLHSHTCILDNFQMLL